MTAATMTPSLAKLWVPAGSPAGGARSALVELRVACPVLGAIVEEFAMQDLGEAFVPPRETPPLRVQSRPLLGDVASLTRQAREARDAGATMRDFDEALYLTAVTAGVPQAIAATQTLLGVFAPPDRVCAAISPRADAFS
jgi:hypothetical protein